MDNKNKDEFIDGLNLTERESKAFAGALAACTTIVTKGKVFGPITQIFSVAIVLTQKYGESALTPTELTNVGNALEAFVREYIPFGK